MPTSARALSFALLTTGLLLAACTPGGDDPTPSGTGGASSKGGSAGSASGGAGPGSGSGGAGTSGSGGGSGAASGGTGGGASTGSGGSTGGAGGAGTGGTGTGGNVGSGGSGSGSDASAGETNPGTGNPGGPHKVVLVYSPDHNGLNIPQADPSLRSMVEILDGMKATHNIIPERILDNEAKAATLGDRALIIVGPNVRQGMVDPALRNIPVPLMASKDGGGMTALGLASMLNTGGTNLDTITIIKADHPLAAGFPLGPVKVFSVGARFVRGGDVGPDAIKIATTPEGAANSWGIFAYDKGGTMAGGVKAPAKRIGFFWHRPPPVTEDGKKLFIAAVAWAIAP
jgi:hypothetical protein